MNNQEAWAPTAPAPWRGPGKGLTVLMLGPLLALTCGVSLAAADRDAKQIVTTVCAACHTESGNSQVPLFPKLAGASPDYLVKQLKDVQSGARKSEIMAPIAAELTNVEIQSLAQYFSAQKRTPAMVAKPALIEEGRVIFTEGNKEAGVPACAGCHLPNGGGAPRFPMIAAQHADYVLQQLRAFHNGTRQNDLGKVMRTVVSRLTDEEMVAVAQYVASMPAVANPR